MMRLSLSRSFVDLWTWIKFGVISFFFFLIISLEVAFFKVFHEHQILENTLIGQSLIDYRVLYEFLESKCLTE